MKRVRAGGFGLAAIAAALIALAAVVAARAVERVLPVTDSTRVDFTYNGASRHAWEGVVHNNTGKTVGMPVVTLSALDGSGHALRSVPYWARDLIMAPGEDGVFNAPFGEPAGTVEVTMSVRADETTAPVRRLAVAFKPGGLVEGFRTYDCTVTNDSGRKMAGIQVNGYERQGPSGSPMAFMDALNPADILRAPTLEAGQSATMPVFALATPTPGNDVTATVWARGFEPAMCTASVNKKVVAYGQPAVVTIHVRDAAGQPPPGITWRMIGLSFRSTGGNWLFMGMPASPPVGDHWIMTVRPKDKTAYYPVFWGNATHAACLGNTFWVTPQVYLTKPSAPAAIRRGTAFFSAGMLKPRHAAGLSSVRIQCFRLEGSRYHLKQTINARNSDASGGTRYAGRVVLGLPGAWRLRAYASADALHAATYSGFKALAVR